MQALRQHQQFGTALDQRQAQEHEHGKRQQPRTEGYPAHRAPGHDAQGVKHRKRQDVDEHVLLENPAIGRRDRDIQIGRAHV